MPTYDSPEEFALTAQTRPGPKKGYRLVQSGTGSGMHEGYQSRPPLYPGAIQTDPYGLFFFPGDLSNSEFVSDLAMEIDGWDIYTGIYDLWEIVAFNWHPSIDDDRHEAQARKIVYVKKVNDLLNQYQAPIAGPDMYEKIKMAPDYVQSESERSDYYNFAGGTDTDSLKMRIQESKSFQDLIGKLNDKKT